MRPCRRRNQATPLMCDRVLPSARPEARCRPPELDLSFTGHAELRMEQRGVTEAEVLTILERATGFEASIVEGRFMIQTRRGQSPWVMIVEPGAEASLLVVVTVYEVSQ